MDKNFVKIRDGLEKIMSEVIQENKMGVQPIGKLIFTMSLPIIISMLIQAFYNIVDSYFVAQYSREALTAVGQAFSAQNLMIGIATGTGVGVNALVSRSLGEKNGDMANRIASNGLLLAGVGYVIALIFGLFFTNIYFDGILSSAQLGGDLDLALVKQEGMDYLQIVSIFSFGLFVSIMFERIIQSTGKTIYTMFSQGAGAIINIVLDPIFICDWGLNMGAKGAAIATVLGQHFGMALCILFQYTKNKEIKTPLKYFKPDFKIIGRIYAIGIPSIIMVGIGSIMYYLMNIIIMSVEAVGGTIFGVYYKLQSFVFMPIFGLNNGVIPIIAYNYGAQKRGRLLRAVRLLVIIAVIIMLIGMALFQAIPAQLFGLFENDASVIGMASTALRIISLSFVFAGFCIAIGSVFQALGKGTFSMYVSIARQVIVLLPVAWLLSRSGELDAIWWAFPIAELMSLVASIVCFVILYRSIIRKIPE